MPRGICHCEQELWLTIGVMGKLIETFVFMKSTQTQINVCACVCVCHSVSPHTHTHTHTHTQRERERALHQGHMAHLDETSTKTKITLGLYNEIKMCCAMCLLPMILRKYPEREREFVETCLHINQNNKHT